MNSEGKVSRRISLEGKYHADRLWIKKDTQDDFGKKRNKQIGLGGKVPRGLTFGRQRPNSVYIKAQANKRQSHTRQTDM
jgi:hypothetical protein